MLQFFSSEDTARPLPLPHGHIRAVAVCDVEYVFMSFYDALIPYQPFVLDATKADAPAAEMACRDVFPARVENLVKDARERLQDIDASPLL